MSKAILFAVVSLLAVFSGYSVYQINQPTPPAEVAGFLWPQPKVVGDFELESTISTDFNLESLRGKWTFLFFGYTYCPDICPTTLSTMAQVRKQLISSQSEKDIQFVFVSVDPARDNIEHMSKYVTYFDESFVGATASLEKLNVLTSQLGVLHLRDDPDDTGNYHVDHSAAISLIDPELRYIGIFQTPHMVEEIANDFMSIKAFIEDLS